jgi:hypothetical protein
LQIISLELQVYPKKYFTYKKVLNALKMQLKVEGKKFKFCSNTFCRLCNSARDLQGQGKEPFSAKKKTEKTTLKTRQLDRQLWAEKKGEGQSIMASEFLTSEWGRLKEGDE